MEVLVIISVSISPRLHLSVSNQSVIARLEPPALSFSLPIDFPSALC